MQEQFAFDLLHLDSAYASKKSERIQIDLWAQLKETIVGVERVISVGCLLCLMAMLQAFVIAPYQAYLRHKNALLQVLLVVLTSACLSQFSVARLYHELKEQDFIGLTTISKMLDYCEFALRQYGKHCYSALYHSSDPVVIAKNFAVAFVYTFLHATTLSLCLVAYEASLTTNSKTFVLIVITNCFIELKISLFKRYDKRQIFETLVSDFVSRFQLCMYFSVILLKAASLGRGKQILSVVTFYLPVAVGVDWVKHYYISSYNTMAPGLFQELFDKGLKTKIVRSRQSFEHTDWDEIVPNALDWANSIVLTMKFSTLPQVCLVLRMAGPELFQHMLVTDWVLLGIGLILLKFGVSTLLTKLAK